MFNLLQTTFCVGQSRDRRPLPLRLLGEWVGVRVVLAGRGCVWLSSAHPHGQGGVTHQPQLPPLPAGPPRLLYHDPSTR